MSKKDYYVIEKNVERFIRVGYTSFLDLSLFNKVKSRLKGFKYSVYYPYKESEKVIIYRDRKPKIRFLEISSLEKLKHSHIMGSLYGTNIDGENFGDIVIYNGHYYIMVMNKVYVLVLKEFNMVENIPIKLKEVSNRILDNYTRNYCVLDIIVPSLRIDSVISKLVNIRRDSLKSKFDNGEIFLNYEVCNKGSYNLKDGDVFSIRKYGKYRFHSIIKATKKNNYIVRVCKYIDNI